MNKAETIAKLYALRAGISYLSLMRKETDEDESKIRAYEKALSADKNLKKDDYLSAIRKRKDLPDIKKGSSDLWDEETQEMFLKVRQANRDKKTIDAYKKFLKKEDDEHAEKIAAEIKKSEEEIEKNKKKIKAWGVAVGIFGAGFIAVLMIMILINFGYVNFAIIPAIVVIVGIVSIVSNKSDIKRGKENIIKNEDLIKHYQEGMVELENKYAHALKTLEKFAAEIDALKEKVNQQLKEIAYPTKRVYLRMKDKYSDILFEDDWKYLDCIIYEIESGRNDTVRAVLQKIDSLSQSASLESYINQAGDKLKKMIAEMRPETRESILNACEELCGGIITNPGVELKNPDENTHIESVWKENLEASDFFDCFEECSNCGILEMMVDVKELKEYF